MSLTDASVSMVETTAPTQVADEQTQFGNTRRLDPSDSIFVFKNTLSDYEEPPSDEEVSPIIPIYIAFAPLSASGEW